MRSHLLFLVVSLFLLPPRPRAQTRLDLPPAADTWVDSSKPAANFGTDSTLKFGRLYVSGARNPLYRAYIRFDLSPFKGRRVRKAELRLYHFGGQGAGTLPKHLRVVTAPWKETAMTWASKAPYGTLLKSFNAGGIGKGWIVLDVTAQVQAWMDGKQANYGFVLKHPREDQAGASRPAYCRSREYGTAAYRPVLRLNLSTRVFGAGCGSPQSPVIGFSGEPSLGRKFTLTLSRGRPSTPAILFLGRSDKKWGSNPLPFDLTPFGFNACYVLCSWTLGFGTAADPSGKASLPIAVPNLPALLRSVTFWQWVQAWTASGAPGLRLSNALEAEIY